MTTNRFLIFIFVISFGLELIISNGLQQCGQLSVYISTTTGTICDAWSTCYSMGARLVLEDDIQTIINCKVLANSTNYFIGLNDLVNERHSNKTGWIFSDGAVLKNINYWYVNQPNDQVEDCVSIYENYLHDVKCQSLCRYICVNLATYVTHSNIFNTINSTRPIFNNDAQTGCYDSISTRNKLHCATKALTNPYYKSFYFESNQKLCVLAKYIDSTLPASYNTTNRNWVGFQ